MVKVKLYKEGAKYLIDNMAENFMKNYMEHDKDRVLDQRLFCTLRDLEQRSFWHVLENIDGSEEFREKARRTFTEKELNDLLDVCLNQALVFPESNAHPGSLKGNMIVYRFASNPQSLTAQATKHISGFTRGLQNGRFWESLTQMQGRGSSREPYSVMADCLLNHFSELDVSYLPKGLEIMARHDNTYAFPEMLMIPDITGIVKDAVPKYADFFLQLDEVFAKDSSLPVSRDAFRKRFFRSYVERVMQCDEDGILDFPTCKSPSAVSLLANEPSKKILAEDPELKERYDYILSSN
jgi:hypothetical protein